MNKLNELLKKQLSVIKEDPVRAFALLYPYILVIGIGFGLFYLSNLNLITRQNIPTVLPDTSKVEELKIINAKTVPPIDIYALSQPTDQVISKGKTLYTTNCVSCHGEDGNGIGAASAGLNPPPRNFLVKDGWKNGSKISQIYQTLQEGIASGGMVAYDFILPEDRLSIIHYIRSTFIPDAPQDSKDELTVLDQTYNLSKGLQISPQIPVGAAIELLSKGTDQRLQKIFAAMQIIDSDKVEKGAEIFRRISNNKMKALTVLTSSTEWHQNQQKFVEIVSGSIYNGGFSSKVNNLGKEDWNALYNYLVKLI